MVFRVSFAVATTTLGSHTFERHFVFIMECVQMAKLTGILRTGICAATAIALGISILSSPASAERARIKPDFPRISGANIGSGGLGYDDPEYQKAIAKRDLTILGIGEGWTRNGMTARDVVRAIKKLNPNILLGNYTNLISVHESFNTQSDKREKMNSGRGPNDTNASDWWARDYNGNRASTYPGTYSTNFTEHTYPDGDGDRYPQWLAKRDYDHWFSDPEWDIWFSDTVLWRPRQLADWSGGKESDELEIAAAYRRGHQAHWAKGRELAPDIVFMPNVNWAESEDVLKRRDIPEYDQQVGAAVLEAIIGKSWSVETWGGWNTMMKWYRRTKSYLIEPKIVSFGLHGDASDYQLFRYGFASCLMDDGYFAFSDTSGAFFASVSWFDEYDLAGASNTSWLGKAVSAPPVSPWQKGVYRRDFENGIALVNPKNNGRQTVSLEPGLRTISGTQDPVRNNGQPVTTITLAERDGVILVREDSVVATRPNPPQLN